MVKLRAYELDGMVVTDELATLAKFAGEVDTSIVEIGSYLGRSAAALAEGSPDSVRVYAVDPYQRYEVLDPDGKPFVYNTLNRNIFISNLTRIGLIDKVTQIQETGVDAGATWSSGPVGLLFIDAKHDYDSVKADFEAWQDHVVVGGFVAFHDYAMEPGVTRFVDEIVYLGEYAALTTTRSTIVLQKVKDRARTKSTETQKK